MEAQYIEIDGDGNKFYFKDRAMVIRHRTDGPACEYANGTKAWYIDGKRHREDGPACEYANGTKAWYIDGKRHREDGPAVEWFDGTKAWYIDGKRHREDGPAVEWSDGAKEWWIYGNKLSEEEFKRRTDPEIILTLDEIAAKLGIEVSKLKIVKEH